MFVELIHSYSVLSKLDFEEGVEHKHDVKRL